MSGCLASTTGASPKKRDRNVDGHFAALQIEQEPSEQAEHIQAALRPGYRATLPIRLPVPAGTLMRPSNMMSTDARLEALVTVGARLDRESAWY